MKRFGGSGLVVVDVVVSVELAFLDVVVAMEVVISVELASTDVVVFVGVLFCMKPPYKMMASPRSASPEGPALAGPCSARSTGWEVPRSWWLDVELTPAT